MNVFVDENIPLSIIQLLKSAGYTVWDLRNTEHQGLEDDKVFQLAQGKSAFFVTTDKDFFHTVPWNFSSHCGVAILALRQPNTHTLREKMKWLLNNFQLSDLQNKVILLRDNTYTVI